MNGGGNSLSDVYAKLDWATKRHDDMQRRFEDFRSPAAATSGPTGSDSASATGPLASSERSSSSSSRCQWR